jgi:ABC-2 type transport system ATP-binding protein
MTSTVVDRPPPATELAGRPAVEVEGVTKAYRGQPVLHGVSLAVAQGEIFGLLGSNGAGKTTTVEIVQGIRSRDGGRVRLLGLDPATERSRLRHLVGAQLQSSALPDRLRVGEALRLFARLAGDVVDWRTLRDDWTLGHLERRPFAALSGGERQRLFLALALVNRPRIVFLDELTQGLDVAARRETWDHVEHIRDEGTTVVLVTHFMDEAERLCDRVGVLHGGRVVATGRPAELVAATGGPVRIGFSSPDPAALAGLDRIPGVVGPLSVGRRPAVPVAMLTGPGAGAPVGLEHVPGMVTATIARRGAVAGTARRTPEPGSGLVPAEIACVAGAVVPVVAELAARGLAPDDLTVTRPSLDDAFVALTRTDTSEGDDR